MRILTGEEQIKLAFDRFDTWRSAYLQKYPEKEYLTIQELVDIYYDMSSNSRLKSPKDI